MYKSPISIYETAMQTIMEQRENAIFAKVQDAFDVQVDKEELIRALKYDRNQYEAGYRDGKADAAPKWIPVTERMPDEYQIVLAACKSGKIFVGEYVDLGWRTLWRIRTARDSTKEITQIVTHWMPLPEAPKEVV